MDCVVSAARHRCLFLVSSMRGADQRVVAACHWPPGGADRRVLKQIQWLLTVSDHFDQIRVLSCESWL